MVLRERIEKGSRYQEGYVLTKTVNKLFVKKKNRIKRDGEKRGKKRHSPLGRFKSKRMID